MDNSGSKSTSTKRNLHIRNTLEFGSSGTTFGDNNNYSEGYGQNYEANTNNDDDDDEVDKYLTNGICNPKKRSRLLPNNLNDEQNDNENNTTFGLITNPNEVDRDNDDELYSDDISYDVCGKEDSDNDNDDDMFTTIYDLIGVPLRLLVAEIPTSESSFAGSSNTQASSSFLSASSPPPSSSLPGGYGSYFRSQPSTPGSVGKIMTQQNNSTNRKRRRRPLLSRSEASCFLQINLLAQQIDALTSVSAQAMQQQMENQCLATKIIKNPYLLPVVSIVRYQGITIPYQCIEQIQKELGSIIQQLKRNVTQLNQFAEQNWNLANSLTDDSTEGMYSQSVVSLGHIKEKLSTIQMEVCSRISEYITTAIPVDPTTVEIMPCSMREFCFDALPFLYNKSDDGTKEISHDIEKSQFVHGSSTGTSGTINNENVDDHQQRTDLMHENHMPQPPSPPASPDLPLSSPDKFARSRYATHNIDDEFTKNSDRNLHDDNNYEKAVQQNVSTPGPRILLEPEIESQQTTIPAAMVLSKLQQSTTLQGMRYSDNDNFQSPLRLSNSQLDPGHNRSPSPSTIVRDFLNRNNVGPSRLRMPTGAGLAATSGEDTRESQNSTSTSSGGTKLSTSTMATSSSAVTCRVQNTIAINDTTITASQYDTIDFLNALSKTAPPEHATTLGSSSSSS